MHTLWHFRLCPHSRTVRIAMAEAGYGNVRLEEEWPWQWRAAFAELSQGGDLPVLQLADGPVIGSATAIAEYVAEDMASAPVPPPGTPTPIDLLPGTREGRAEIRRLVDRFLVKLHREVARDLIMERVHGPLRDGPAYRPEAGILDACRTNLRQHLQLIGFLAYQRRWLAGDRFSLADIAAAAQVSCLDYLGEIPWSEHAGAKEWYQRMKSRPSLRLLLAERLPGLPPPIWYTDADF
jgi:glutathione S-transferase